MARCLRLKRLDIVLAFCTLWLSLGSNDSLLAYTGQADRDYEFDTFNLDDLLSADDDGDSATAYFDPTEVKQINRDVLDSPEFRGLQRMDLNGGVVRESDPVESSDGTPPSIEMAPVPEYQVPGFFQSLASAFSGGLGKLILIMLAALIIGGLAYYVVRYFASWRKTDDERSMGVTEAEKEEKPFESPGAKSPDAWLEAARASAKEGRFDQALHYLLIGVMAHIERSGAIQAKQGLTYGDYLRAVPRGTRWRGVLMDLIRMYCPVGFGRRVANYVVFEQAELSYVTALSESETIAESHGTDEMGLGHELPSGSEVMPNGGVI